MQQAIDSLVTAMGRASIAEGTDDRGEIAMSASTSVDDVLIVFDPRMLFHVSPKQHPEQASRIISIFARLQTQVRLLLSP